MIPGVVGSSQYVLPLSKISTATFAGVTATAASRFAGDGTRYYCGDRAAGTMRTASPFPNSTYSNMSSTFTTSTDGNNQLTYENGRFFEANSGGNSILTWVNSGDTRTSVTVTTPRIVRWFAPMSAWVAVGNSGAVATSTDGTTWTNRTAISTTATLSVAATDGTTLVVAGTGGAMFSTTSTNPASISWSTRTSSFGANDIRNMAYFGGNWAASGAAGNFAYSTNGTTWTQKDIGAPATSTILGLVYHMGRWIAFTQGAGGGATDGYGIRSNTSDPSGSWTTVTTTLTTSLSRPFSDKRYIVWNIAGGTVGYSR